MAGIVNKIGEALHLGGGQKDEDKHKEAEKHHKEEAEKHHSHGSDHKEGGGLLEKVKEKIHGGDESKAHKEHSGEEKKKKKKKKEKKEGEHGHGHGHGSDSSSSDSD